MFANIDSLFFLHGMFGAEDDRHRFGLSHAVAPSLHDPRWWDEEASLDTWARQWTASIPEGSTLVGYSLGGRLALHALVVAPHLWKKVILISTHPGLTTEKEREERCVHDLAWSHRFLEEDWKEVMEAWNAQPIFRGKECARFRPSDAVLLHHFTHFSLGRQADFRERLQGISVPVVWVAGGEDPKFVALAEEMAAKHTTSSCILVPEAGHRVAWDNPSFFQD